MRIGEGLTPEIEAKGMTAYEQVRAFERLRTWRLPLTYALAAVLPAALGVVAWRMGYAALLGAGLVVAVLLAVRGWMEWTRLRRRHAENCALLAELERTYGAALPWVQVENHFAELEAIRREQAERRHGP